MPATGSTKIAPSIAVLPFTNLSPEPENEYIADGITEEIINALAQLKGLQVAARTSSFAFKGKTPDLVEVAAKLHVAHVLTGSVRRAGSRLRITALRAGAGPGVEFLEYLAPRDGRPYPADAKANDLLTWHTNFITNDLGNAERRLRDGKFAFVSPGTVGVSADHAGFKQALAVRDPDGHASRLQQQ